MDLYCQVTDYGLVPLYDSDLEEKQRLKVGTIVKCKISKPRNLEHHKKFFALVRITFDNLPYSLIEQWNIHNVDDMLRRFKRDLGYYNTYINDDGEREIEYQSISFSAMEQNDFTDFYNKCLDLILYKYIVGLNRQDLIESIEAFK